MNRTLKLSSLLTLALLTLFAFNGHTFGKTSMNYAGTILVQDDDEDDDDEGRRGRRDGGRWRGGDDDQRRSDKEARRQQRDSDRESRRQQRESDRESRRQQQWSDWNSRRQQWESDRSSRRQQEWSDRRGRGSWNRGDDDDDDDDDERRGRRSRRHERRVYDFPQQSIWNNIWNGGQGNWRGDNRYRKQLRRELKEQRKAQRRYEREQRRYSRSYNQYSQRNNYENNYYAGNDYYYDEPYNNGSGWKQQLLRAVIGNVIGGNLGGGDNSNLLSQYAQVYNSVPFNRSNYGNRYVSVPQYGQYYAEPNYYYDNNEPVYGYGSPYNYAYDQDSFGGGNDILGSLPIAELIQQFTGGNDFVSSLIGGFLTQGYDQGFLAGQYARRNGLDEDDYYDPYVYEDGMYDPYSVTLGQNRQLLSEGYDLGYQDALSGQSDYDPIDDGNVDLVSLLLNNVLGNNILGSV